MKYLLITNVPSPYRVKQYNLIGKELGADFFIIYTDSTFKTTQMQWTIPKLTHNHMFLDSKNKYIIKKLVIIVKIIAKERPKIVITSGFNIIMLLGFSLSKIIKAKHIVFSDSWLHSINSLSIIHHLARRIVIKRSDAFICVGKKGKEYLRHFDAIDGKIFLSRLSDDINLDKVVNHNKEYDIMFSGQFIERKNPEFFVDVALALKDKIPNLKVLLVGSGPLSERICSLMKDGGIEYKYPGFISPHKIKEYYIKTKVFLFPTKDDPWGMVVNDAMSVGVPVITSPFSGAADDLVIDGNNGFVIDLNVELWVEKVYQLLTNEKLYNKFSINALDKVKEFSVEKAANNFVFALSKTVEE